MRQTIILLLALLIVGIKGQEYKTVNTFVEDLQGSGFFDVLSQAKCQNGSDVAIEGCRELVSSQYCEETIRVYMPSKCNNPQSKDLNDMINNKEILEFLLKKWTMDEILKILKKLNEKYKKLN